MLTLKSFVEFFICFSYLTAYFTSIGNDSEEINFDKFSDVCEMLHIKKPSNSDIKFQVGKKTLSCNEAYNIISKQM